MKSLIVFLLFAASAFAQPAVVAGFPVVSTGSATTTNSTPSATYTTGNAIACFVVYQDAGGASISVSDATNGNYVLGTQTPEGSFGYIQGWAYLPNIAGFTGTVSATMSPSGDTVSAIQCYQLTNIDVTSPKDVDANTLTTAVSGTATTSVFSTTAPVEIALVGIVQGGSQFCWTQVSPYTYGGCDGPARTTTEYDVFSSVQNGVTASFFHSGSAASVAMNVLTLKGLTVAAPIFSPIAGSYVGTQSVTITSSTSGAVIWYNTTGTFTGCTYASCSGATQYSGPVSVSSSETLYALGTKAGYTSSSTASAYTISAIGSPYVAITAPAANASISGFAYTLRASVSNAPSADHLIWRIDGEIAGNPVRTPPYSQVWDTFYGGNGSGHVAVATLYDALNNVISASNPIPFTIANTLVDIVETGTGTNNTYNPTWSVAVANGVGGSGCTGSTWTSNCVLTGTLGGTQPGAGFCVFVDGARVYNSAASSFTLNTALYPNGPHNVTFIASGLSPSCDGANQWGIWEQQATFSNGATHLWLEASARETWLCQTPVSGCPGSTTLTGTIVNTDGSTESATLTSCVIETATIDGYPLNTGIVTSSGANGCTISEASVGSAAILATESGGLTRMAWVYVQSSSAGNVTQCFGKNGTIYQSWTAANSCFFIASAFFSSAELTSTLGINPSGVNAYLKNYKLQGFNTVEPGFAANAPNAYQSTTQSAFQAAQDTNVGNWCSWAATAGMFFQLDGSGWTMGYNFYFDRGYTLSYSPHGTTYLASDWGSKCPSAANFTPILWGLDEVNDNDGPKPYQPQPIMGGTVSSISASGGTCTVTVTSAFGFQTGYSNPTFIITGATSAGFNSVPPTFYSSSTRNPNPTFTFSCPSVANGTYNSTTDPNLLIENMADMTGSGYQETLSTNKPPPSASGVYVNLATYTSGITATGSAGQTCNLSFSNGGGTGATATVALTGTNTIASGRALTITGQGVGFTSPPTTATASNGTASCSGTATVFTYLTDYPRWNGFQQFMTDYYAATNPPLITWPNGYLSAPIASQNWMYDSRMANFAKVYVDASGGDYRPSAHAVNYLTTGSGDRYRAYMGNTTEPFLMETAMTGNSYGMQGVFVPVASCAGNLFTFSSPHGIGNVHPWITRFTVPSGSCAGQYWVISAPSATTATVWKNFGTNESTSGTITFANGHAYSTPITATASPTAITNAQTIVPTNSGGHYIACEAGGIFTISGTGTALDGTQGYWPFNNPGLSNSSPCTSSAWSNTYGLWGSIPALSGTGGTAQINTDNYMVYGRNSADNLTGPIYAYASITYCLLLGCAGHSGFAWGTGGFDVQDVSYTQANDAYLGGGSINISNFFGSSTLGNIQNPYITGALPGVTGNPSIDDHAWAMGIANLLAERLAPYAYQPHSSSPDYGPNVEAAAHSGTPGNMLMLQSMSMNSQTPTVNLAPYLVSGQNVIRYLADHTSMVVTTISAGTTSDTPTMKPGGTVTYLFPQNSAAGAQQPLVSARLADVANAAKIVVRYSYLPYWVDKGTAVFDCGTGTCVLPVDRNLGTIYYRLLYLSSSGAVLATSDLQTL
jgi:hypothetical protein